MTAEESGDDVIHIRVDTAAAVREFMDVLASQAAEGETRAPANPANRAVFRELAPYRLLEYEYVGEGIGGIEGVFLGFPDGSIFSVADDIPEEAVDDVVAGDPAHLPPIYVHVVLAEARPAAAIDSFLAALAGHVGKPLIGLYRDQAGQLTGHAYECAGECGCAEQLARAVASSGAEAAMHLTKAQVLERFAAGSQSVDGRAYAQLTVNFLPHLLEFASAAERDDFIAWSKGLCDSGFADVPRPATVAPAGAHAVALIAPRGETAQDYWDYIIKSVSKAERPQA